MRINSRKIRKILGRVRTAPKRIFETFSLKKHQDASAWMQHSALFIWFRKSNKDFSYTTFSCKKINVEKILKLWENCYLIILSIHIWNYKFQGVIEELRSMEVSSWRASVETKSLCDQTLLLPAAGLVTAPGRFLRTTWAVDRPLNLPSEAAIRCWR
jgi:hypothetical protein